jgi:hypothetical protein
MLPTELDDHKPRPPGLALASRTMPTDRAEFTPADQRNRVAGIMEDASSPPSRDAPILACAYGLEMEFAADGQAKAPERGDRIGRVVP